MRLFPLMFKQISEVLSLAEKDTLKALNWVLIVFITTTIA